MNYLMTRHGDLPRYYMYMRLISHPLAGFRIHVSETFGEPAWTGLLCGGMKEFGSVKYVVIPDDADYFILIEPSMVHIWKAKNQSHIPPGADSEEKHEKRPGGVIDIRKYLREK